jgi:membrane protein YqaA with SNARE-associated domain
MTARPVGFIFQLAVSESVSIPGPIPPSVLPTIPSVPTLPLGPTLVPISFHSGLFETLVRAAETATGPLGLVIIFIYSFLIAFVLPLPSEIVLATPLRLGLPYWVEIGLIMLTSGAGKAAGSVFAFAIGHQAKESGPVIRLLRNSRFDVVEWSERRTVELARNYGYAGLAGALCVPGFPDTLSIYAFSVLEEDYLKFALATFVGSVGRLVVTVIVLGGASFVI